MFIVRCVGCTSQVTLLAFQVPYLLLERENVCEKPRTIFPFYNYFRSHVKNKKPRNNESRGFGEAIYSIYEYLKTIRSSSLPPIKRMGELN